MSHKSDEEARDEIAQIIAVFAVVIAVWAACMLLR